MAYTAAARISQGRVINDPRRFRVKQVGYPDRTCYLVWDHHLARQHDPVPYVDREPAARMADFANRVIAGELDGLRDPRWIKD